MGKKKKEVLRCNVCGVKATTHIAGDLSVCDNPVCEVATRNLIEQATGMEAIGQNNNNKGAAV